MICRAFIAFFLLISPALADDSIPLLYTRETITIQRLSQAPLPWQAAGEPQPSAIPASGVTFDVEVRDARSYYNQKDWFNLSGPTNDSGVLLVFAAPGQSPIIPSKQYAPLDILFIDAQGRVTQIVPNILLSSLSQQIIPKNPVLAFLFLKGQTCQHLNINPGDIVDYKAFTKPPVVLGDPVTILDNGPQARNPRAIPPRKTTPITRTTSGVRMPAPPLPLMPAPRPLTKPLTDAPGETLPDRPEDVLNKAVQE